MSNKQKKHFLILLSVLVFTVCPLSLTFGQITGPASPFTIDSIIIGAVDTAWVIFAGLGVICFILAGIIFLTAQGAPEKLKTAKAAVLWGTAGILVGILGFSAVTLISNIMK